MDVVLCIDVRAIREQHPDNASVAAPCCGVNGEVARPFHASDVCFRRDEGRHKGHHLNLAVADLVEEV